MQTDEQESQLIVNLGIQDLSSLTFMSKIMFNVTKNLRGGIVGCKC